jgi:O-antigen/teichoic acid export membrane protein
VAKSVRKSLFWQAYNVAGMATIQIVYYAILARLLDPKDFGIIAIANSFINFATLFSQIGMGPALIQHKNPSSRHISTSFFTNIGFGSLLYVLTIVLAFPIAMFFESEDLLKVLPVLSLSFIFSSVASSSISLIQRAMNFRYMFLAENVSYLIGMVVGVILAFNGYEVWSLVYGTLVYQFCLMLIVLWKTRIKLSFGWSKKEFNELFHFGAGLTLIRVNNYLTNSGVNLLLGKLMPLNILGIFERSFRIMMIPGKMLGDVIDKVMFPAMSRKQDDNHALTSMYERNLSYSLLITIPLGIWLSLNTEMVVLVLLGDQWLDAIPALRVLFIAVPFRVTIRLTDSVIRAKGLVYKSAGRKFLYTLVLFISLYFGSFRGLEGLSWVILLTSVFQYLNMSSLAVSGIGMSWAVQWRPFMKAIPAVLIFSLPAAIILGLISTELLVMMMLKAAISLVVGLFSVMLFYRFFPSVLGSSVSELLAPVVVMAKSKLGIKLK